MRTLTVTDFACIKNASLEINKVTLIIGPQASGKSVLCKLAYFLFDAANLQFASLSKGESFEKFSAEIKIRFTEWFPMEAWGTGKFRIQLTAGDYSILITRKIWKSKVQDDFRLKLSSEFKEQYESLLTKFEKIHSQNKSRDRDFPDQLEFDWRLRQNVTQSLTRLMGRDSISYQAFVPAGRSFFTSIGKAIAAFEQGRVLDPLIVRFGRMYTSYKDSRRYRGLDHPADGGIRKNAEEIMQTLLGGTLERDGEKEFILTPDGRRVPLSSMSSGQQEILPLLTFLPWVYGSKDDRLCYIEEPEAHLFPASQAKLIEALVMAANVGAKGTNLVMTTHSPYVLTKINNLLKAGSISRKLSEEQRKTLESRTSRRAWLLARNVRAYAIKDGNLCSILGNDGLIDADYLDEASGQLSEEFSHLLDLEFSNA